MIYDCFLFNDELELLELRLNELNDVVDKVLLIESDRTMTGLPKPRYYDENKHLFAPFHHKIIYHTYDYPMPPDTPRDVWRRDVWSRNHLKTVLGHRQDDDVIILSDADEIPRPDIIRQFNVDMGIRGLVQQWSQYRFNCYSTLWNSARIISGKAWNKGYPQIIRLSECPKMEGHGGWHFSFMVPIERIQRKIQSWAHQEHNKPEITSLEHIRYCVETPVDLFGRDMVWKYCPIDGALPRYVLDHLDKYKQLDLIKDP